MKYFLRPTLTAVALAVAMSLSVGVHAQAAKSTAAAAAPASFDKEKASYVLGWLMANQLPPLFREELDPATVADALKTNLSGGKLKMSDEEAKQVYESFQTYMQGKAKKAFEDDSAKNKSDGDAFLAKNKKEHGVKTTASGLQYQVITQGSGPRPGKNDTVQVNYKGTFVNGTVFDDSSKHEGSTGPASIPLANVIPGFREGLQLMPVGSHYKLFIPANLAYGDHSQQVLRGVFPPNMTVIFDVSLVKTGPTTTAAPSSGHASGESSGNAE